MIRVFSTVALVGAQRLAAISLGLPPVRYEQAGWSKPGPRYRPDRPSVSIAVANRWNGEPHRHGREIARRQRQALPA